jgi:hypothetical protein
MPENRYWCIKTEAVMSLPAPRERRRMCTKGLHPSAIIRYSRYIRQVESARKGNNSTEKNQNGRSCRFMSYPDKDRTNAQGLWRGRRAERRDGVVAGAGPIGAGREGSASKGSWVVPRLLCQAGLTSRMQTIKWSRDLQT